MDAPSAPGALRILSVDTRPAFPPRRGGQARVHALLAELGRRHEVTHFAHAPLLARDGEPADGAPYTVVRHSSLVAEAAARLSERRYRSTAVLAGAALSLERPRRLGRLLAWADVALVEGPWQVAHCRRTAPEGRLVLDLKNVERSRFSEYARICGDPSWARRLRRIERLERRALAAADLAIAVSDADRDELVEIYGADPGQIVVVPNGADTRRIAPVCDAVRTARKRELGLPPGPVVLYLGSRFPSNLDGLARVERLATMATSLTFLVVGGVSPRRRHGPLVATGSVPDVLPYLEASDLAVCPVAYRGGTKIKLLEGLAAGLPTVAFAESLAGTGLEDGRHVLVSGHDERSLLAALEQLAGDRELARRLAEAGRGLVATRYDWRHGASRLEQALLRVTGGTPAGAVRRGSPRPRARVGAPRPRALR